MKSVVAHDALVTEPVPGVNRVQVDGTTVGYVVEAPPVYVSLRGAVYNTSCEVGQSLDLESAVLRLLDD